MQDIDFGGFLKLQIIELPGGLCEWPVDKFDACSVRNTIHIKWQKDRGDINGCTSRIGTPNC